jgi:hypothetical protein
MTWLPRWRRRSKPARSNARTTALPATLTSRTLHREARHERAPRRALRRSHLLDMEEDGLLQILREFLSWNLSVFQPCGTDKAAIALKG